MLRFTSEIGAPIARIRERRIGGLHGINQPARLTQTQIEPRVKAPAAYYIIKEIERQLQFMPERVSDIPQHSVHLMGVALVGDVLSVSRGCRGSFAGLPQVSRRVAGWILANADPSKLPFSEVEETLGGNTALTEDHHPLRPLVLTHPLPRIRRRGANLP